MKVIRHHDYGMALDTMPDEKGIVADNFYFSLYELDKVDEISKKAGKKYSRSKRPPLNFVEMGIKIGETISTADGLISCKIVEEKKVEYENEIMSLTRLTRKLKDIDYDFQPGPHWFYNGKSLKDIYDETYSYED